MKIRLKIIKSKSAIVLHIGHLQERKQVKIYDATPEQWNEQAQMITTAHPQFSEFYPYMNDLLVTARKVTLDRVTDVNRAISTLIQLQYKDPELIAWL
jgi:hypothetical protein